MEAPERAVCCGLCLCMAVAVLSSVSLVYLTAIVYMPAKRELESGLLDQPAMCTTVNSLHTDHCAWASCFEWCLSKPNFCTQVHAEVRKNGTNIVWKDCSLISDTVCPVSDEDLVERITCNNEDECEPVNKRFFARCGVYQDCPENPKHFKCEQHHCVSSRETRNCKKDGECVQLDHQYQCVNGLCRNISRVNTCTYNSTGDSFDCRDKRNCITLTGLFECNQGICTQINWPWDCRRRCSGINIDKRNLIIISGDRTVSAVCGEAETEAGISINRRRRKRRNSGILEAPAQETLPLDGRVEHGRRHQHVLLLSCTRVNIDNLASQISGVDCVNGTRISRGKLLRSSTIDQEMILDILDKNEIQVKSLNTIENSSLKAFRVQETITSNKEASTVKEPGTSTTSNLVENKEMRNLNSSKVDLKDYRLENVDWTILRKLFIQENTIELGRSEIEGIPSTSQLIIYPYVKLYVNTEMCVNTLMKECTTFLLDHSTDGRNYSSRNTYPCFYNPLNSDYVTVRFDVQSTKDLFLISFSIPASLWIFSCSFLVTSSKILRISERTGQMRLKCRRLSTASLNPDSRIQELDEIEDDIEELDLLEKERVCKRRMAVNY